MYIYCKDVYLHWSTEASGVGQTFLGVGCGCKRKAEFHIRKVKLEL